MLDTNIAIGLRDGDSEVMRRLAGETEPVCLSVVTVVELEGGVYVDAQDSELRRARLDVMLEGLSAPPFDAACARAYGGIVAAAGYSRRKVVDRMIAAQALVLGARLATRNEADFVDIPSLTLDVW